MAKEKTIEFETVPGDQTTELTQPSQPECRHHWLIESPRGATSEGVCKLCGAVREFRNTASDAYWEDDSGSTISRWNRRPVAVTVSGDEDEMTASPQSEVALTV